MKFFKFHHHVWSKSIYQQYEKTAWGSYSGDTGLITIVTQKCDCGKHRQQELKGHIGEIK